MSIDHLFYRWSLDPEGNAWAWHQCGDDCEAWRLPPPWHLTDEGGVQPSFDCRRCGRHTILTSADRVDWPTLAALLDGETEAT